VTGAVRLRQLVSKGSGGLSGHVMHGDGGCGGKFSHVQFLDSKFNGNYGFGLRQDGMGEYAVIERCQFNGNRINGGMMWEITYGPITVRDARSALARGRRAPGRPRG
jgi:hypothetical protein